MVGRPTFCRSIQTSSPQLACTDSFLWTSTIRNLAISAVDVAVVGEWMSYNTVSAFTHDLKGIKNLIDKELAIYVIVSNFGKNFKMTMTTTKLYCDVHFWCPSRSVAGIGG